MSKKTIKDVDFSQGYTAHNSIKGLDYSDLPCIAPVNHDPLWYGGERRLLNVTFNAVSRTTP